jgi:hypothetical protein
MMSMPENPVTRQAELDQAWAELLNTADLAEVFLLVKQLDVSVSSNWALTLRGGSLELAKKLVDLVAMELAHRAELEEKDGL